MFNFLFKLVLLIIVLFVLSQLEYKGRKLQTYAEEFIKSYRSKKGVVYIEENIKELKSIKSESKPATKKIIKIVKEPENGYEEITEEDREELMNVFE
jgi:predicted choloylglycine hydrolase